MGSISYNIEPPSQENTAQAKVVINFPHLWRNWAKHSIRPILKSLVRRSCATFLRMQNDPAHFNAAWTLDCDPGFLKLKHLSTIFKLCLNGIGKFLISHIVQGLRRFSKNEIVHSKHVIYSSAMTFRCHWYIALVSVELGFVKEELFYHLVWFPALHVV